MRKTAMLLVALTLSVALGAADKYAGEIFRLGGGVRNFALGGCGLTDTGTAAPAYWNPALTGLVKDKGLELMHAEEFAGLYKYDTASLNWQGDWSLFAARIGVDGVPLTRLANPDSTISDDNRPYKYKSVNNADYIFYGSLARQWRPNLYVGVAPKLVYRTLAENNGWGVGADLGLFWQASSHWATAAVLRDAFTTYIYWDGGESESVYPALDMEASYQAIVPWIDREIKIYAGAEGASDGRDESATVAAGPFSFDPHLGLDVQVYRQTRLFAGYNREYFTGGLSLAWQRWRINYALMAHDELDNSQRVSLEVQF